MSLFGADGSHRVSEPLIVELRGRIYPMNPLADVPVPDSLKTLPDKLYNLLPIAAVGPAGATEFDLLTRVRRDTFKQLAEVKRDIEVFSAAVCRWTIIVRGGSTTRVVEKVFSAVYEEQLRNVPTIPIPAPNLIRLEHFDQTKADDFRRNIESEAKKSIEHLVKGLVTVANALVAEQNIEWLNYDAGLCRYRVLSTHLLNWPVPDDFSSTGSSKVPQVVTPITTEPEMVTVGLAQASANFLPAGNVRCSDPAIDLIKSIPKWLEKYVRVVSATRIERVVTRQGGNPSVSVDHEFSLP